MLDDKNGVLTESGGIVLAIFSVADSCPEFENLTVPRSDRLKSDAGSWIVPG